MRNDQKIGVIAILILVAVIFVVGYSVILPILMPPNIYEVYQSEQLAMTDYSFPYQGPLTVTLKNTGTGSVDLSASQYSLSWAQPYQQQESIEWLTIAENSCSSSVISPGVTCQLTFNLPSDVTYAMQSACPPYCQAPISDFYFRGITPHGASYQYEVSAGTTT